MFAGVGAPDPRSFAAVAGPATVLAVLSQGRAPDAIVACPPRRLWIHGRLLDVLLGWCWLPIAVVVRANESNVTEVHWLVGVIFLISFAHQPLTLGLVYADPVQRRAHRTIYRWTPLVAAALIVVGLHISLTLVGVMAALWNAEHTLMQRYGVMRIYGRKAGDDLGRLEKPMLIAWLATAVLFIATYVDLERLIRRLGVGRTNATGIRALATLHAPAAALFWLAAAGATALSVRWWRAQRASATTAAPKVLYTLGTLGLLVMVMIDPLAGIAGYVAAHSIEYFGIVHSSLRTRRDDALVARASRTARRRAALYAAYLGVIVALIQLTAKPMHGKLYAFVVLFLGALHIFYDGFVWKLRRPAVAASLGIVAPSA
ncbi:MAG: hypothetical protein JWM12_172 [Ilumatobacteraceae bacterium]|nr:hypothetical protein [Ilumatobacteraceae bacterium]